MRPFRSHGSGAIEPARFLRLGARVIFEPGALVFHPETIEIDDDVYVGHYAILKGWHRGALRIGAGTWIGQQAFLHAAGGLEIGQDVGIGPGARVITSTHEEPGGRRPIMAGALRLRPVALRDGCDLGVGCVVLPGVTVGAGAQVGAGAVVTRDVPDGAVVAGAPARLVRLRPA